MNVGGMQIYSEAYLIMSIKCPVCGAGPQEHCKTPKGDQRPLHERRNKAYRKSPNFVPKPSWVR